LEEDWYFQALQECYIPLLRTLEAAHADPAQRPRLTLGLSPTLLSLLSDEALNRGFLPWLMVRRDLLSDAPADLQDPAEALAEELDRVARDWRECDGRLLDRFRRLQQVGVVDLITCAATHGYLPLLRDSPEAVRAQLLTAVREHQRLLGERPLGIWLPECAYYEGLDQLLMGSGLRYSLLDGHGLLHAQPRPRYGVYAPICSPAGVAFFGRDSASTLPVWSASQGYPGDGLYREFHRDLGWDLPEECPLEHKQPYGPLQAQARVAEHAALYIQSRVEQLHGLTNTIERPPLLVAPFDAELFGHWWFEGPNFLGELFRQGPAQDLAFTHLRDVLAEGRPLQVCHPSPSSWGQGGYHDYWLNDSNAWVVPEWQRASRAMVRRVNRGVGSAEQRRWLTQAGRELLLAQSSDWSFILRAGTTTGLARERIHRHLDRFWRLMDAIENHTPLKPEWVRAVEREDGLFPSLNAADWTTRP
jgi:1,4-alpha-glucan branching enzyme